MDTERKNMRTLQIWYGDEDHTYIKREYATDVDLQEVLMALAVEITDNEDALKENEDE